MTTTFRVSSGLPAAEHRRRMGDAVWLFLWYLDRQTGGHGWVLKSRRASRGRPLTDDEAARDLGVHVKTIGAQRRSLASEGYIVTERTRVGHRVQVTNQKKFPGGNADTTSREGSRGNVGTTSQRERGDSISGSRGNRSAPMMEGPRSLISSLQQEVQEVIYRSGATGPARTLFEEHATQFANTFQGSPPTPTEDDLALVDDLLDTNQNDLVDLLRRFWVKVREVRGTDQARFWRPTIRTFVGRVPDVLMLPPAQVAQNVNLELPEHRDAFDTGTQAHDAGLDPGANPHEHGVLRTAWFDGWKRRAEP